jgi:hypothetical protein
MAATLNELLAQYQAQQAYAESQAKEASSGINTGLAIGSGALGLVGSITAPFAAQYIGDMFGLNKRTAAEERALQNIRDVASGQGRTAAQSALEYQRARTGRMATQAASMGPARERAARQLVGQEQGIAAQQELAGQAASVKMQEQAQAQRALADIETRAGEAERQRQRQLVSGAISGGLGALSQAYGGYAADKLRQADLKAKAAASGAAIESIKGAMEPTGAGVPVQQAPVVQPAPVATPVAAAMAPAQVAPEITEDINLLEIPQSKLVPRGRALAATRRPARAIR